MHPVGKINQEDYRRFDCSTNIDELLNFSLDNMPLIIRKKKAQHELSTIVKTQFINLRNLLIMRKMITFY